MSGLALDLRLAANMLEDAAAKVTRIVRGEVTAPPRAHRETACTTTGSLSLLRVLCVDSVSAELLGCRVAHVATVADAVKVLAIQAPAPDAIVVPSEAHAALLRRATPRPVVVEGPELRTRLRLAVAAWATRQIETKESGP